MAVALGSKSTTESARAFDPDDVRILPPAPRASRRLGNGPKKPLQMVGAFGKKPSNAHVVWTTGGPGPTTGTKRFDFEYMELWASQFGIDYESQTRVDHDRADEPREQHACIFEWSMSEGETIELDGEAWTMGERETPRTFVEIDDAGIARIQGWTNEMDLDVLECWLDGPKMLFNTRERGPTLVDGRKLLSAEKRTRLV